MAKEFIENVEVVDEVTDVVAEPEKIGFKDKAKAFLDKEHTFTVGGVAKKVIIGSAALGGAIMAGVMFFKKGGSDEEVTEEFYDDISDADDNQ